MFCPHSQSTSDSRGGRPATDDHEMGAAEKLAAGTSCRHWPRSGPSFSWRAQVRRRRRRQARRRPQRGPQQITASTPPATRQQADRWTASRRHTASIAPLVAAAICAALLASGAQQTSASPQRAGSIIGLQQAMAQMLQVFNGNDSAQLDANHFKVLKTQGDAVLVGAR